MTVSSTTNRKSFTGDAVTTSFGTSPVVFFDSSELVVQVVTTATGAATTLTENTHYTVTGGAGSTGTVSLAGGSSPYGAPSAAQTLLIRRVLPLTQTDDFVNNDINDAEVTEDRFDKTVMQIQQLDEELGRGLVIPASETATDALTVLPFDRASKFLAFNASKELIASSGTVDSAVPVSAFMETVLDDTTAADARTTLGFTGTGTVATANIEDAAVTVAKLAAAIYASQGEAQAGTENTKLMTALRVAEAIIALSPKLKMVSTTRDVSLSSGNVAITGAGFAPKMVIVAGVNGSYGSSANQVGLGFGRSAAEVFGISNSNNVSSGAWSLFNDRLFSLSESGIILTDVDLVSLDADGCT